MDPADEEAAAAGLPAIDSVDLWSAWIQKQQQQQQQQQRNDLGSSSSSVYQPFNTNNMVAEGGEGERGEGGGRRVRVEISGTYNGSGGGSGSSGSSGGGGGGHSVDIPTVSYEQNGDFPRKELAIGGALNNAHGGGPNYLQTTVEGLIQTQADGTTYKLLIGNHSEAMWTGPIFPNSSSRASDWNAWIDCGDAGCLFNLDNDPSEHTNLANELPDLAVAMRKRISVINATVFSPVRGPRDPKACEVAQTMYGGYWGPFVGEERKL